MNLAYREHERAARLIAKELEEHGYAVFLDPTPEQFPFSLEGYQPDLLATKADDNLIIEIKSRKSREILERYRKVIDIIQAHPGWKFLVKTFADTPQAEDIAAPTVGDSEIIKAYLGRAEGIALSETPELAVPYLWNVIVALLRQNALTAAPNSIELPDRSLINQLYSLGQMSAEQFESLRKWQELRNRAVHNIDFSVDAKDVKAMLEFAGMLFSKLAH